MPARRKRLSQFFGDDYRESSRDEWEQFLLEPCIPPDEDPIQWWNENTKRFTKLGYHIEAFIIITTYT
ncbi:zinc finger BED domain-containing protein 4-like, partial [Tachysurus ichikawai]